MYSEILKPVKSVDAAVILCHILMVDIKIVQIHRIKVIKET